MGNSKSPNNLPRTDTDLCSWAKIWDCPANLTLHKVKSHQSLSPCGEQQCRAALGNAVADGAAKEARKAEIPTVVALLDEVEDRYIRS